MTELTDHPDIYAKNDNWQWRIVRRIAFSFDAERMHETAIRFLKIRSLFSANDLGNDSIARHASFKRNLMGLEFPNPIGLAAGFDVDADCLPALQDFGFGFIEVGGITEHPHAGNKRPRIFRLPKDKALINRLNFYNKGATHLRRRIADLREKNRLFIPIGVNLGKAKSSSLDDVPSEYARTFKEIHDVADYVTINVSCPNSQGLKKYQTMESLDLLLNSVANVNHALRRPLPLLLKLGPDLHNEEAIACSETALKYRLAGLIVSNTTVRRNGLVTTNNFGPGGLSGQPLFERSTQLLRCVAKDYGDKLILVGSGGIMDGSNALAKLNAGANLLQVYTGFIYGGPSFIWQLLHYLQHYHLQ